jgi:D-2-hydroxyglutarate dehydrogenase
LGAAGTCTIGGNLATNAGGVRFVRYGSLRGACVGLEFVQADGTVVDCARTTLRKDNTGYALPQLLIGSEGTLGVITKCCIACPSLSPFVNVAWLACRDFDQVRKVLTTARSTLGEILSAVEFLDRGALDATLRAHPGIEDPLQTDAPFRVLVETAGCNEEHDAAKLDRFLEAIDVEDGCVAPTTSAMNALWTLREGVSDAMTSRGFVYKYDVSLPPVSLYDLVEKTTERLEHLDVDVAGYGHVGDANLHLNVCDATGYRDEVHSLLEPWVYEEVARSSGSISAEHGVGQCKPDYLYLNKSIEAIELMGAVKKALDPNLILNPYKVLPATVL